MSSSGLIYVAIVAAWAAYLVPRCLRRSDDQLPRMSDARAVESPRVLQRRKRVGRGRDEAHYSLLRLRPAVRPTPVVKKRRVAQPWYPPAYGPPYRPAPRPAASRPGVRPGARARSVGAGVRPVDAATLARRRRALGFLVFVSAVCVSAGAVGWIPGWAGALPVSLLLAYVAELRAQVRRRRALKLRQRRGEAVAKVRRRRLDVAARLEAVRRVLRPEAPEAPPALPVNDPPVEVHDGWRPVAVPLPTYVTAPRAPIQARRIDLSGEGAWASGGGMSDDDTTEIPVVPASVSAPVSAPPPAAAVAAPAPTEEPIERRAVND
jgi:hypothetical protein